MASIRLRTSFLNRFGKEYKILINDSQDFGGLTVKYGLLYNWYAATDARLICADGWEVPTQSHYSTLKAYLTANGYGYGGSGDDVGKSVASVNNWAASATAGTVGNLPENNNTSGFNLPPSGQRQYDGTFVGLTGNWFGWQLTEYSALYGYYSVIASEQSYFNIGFGGLKKEGQSIRPIKTTTSLTHGQTGTYTGNDGKVYRTICIGTQEWLADNLCETKFRNGEYIHGFELGEYTPISDANWAALTIAGCCAYDDTLSNAYEIDNIATEYIAGGDGFVLEYQTNGNDYLTTPIVASTVTLPIHIRDDNRAAITQFLEDLVSSDETRFTVRIYENDVIYWRGKVQIERVQIPDKFYTEIDLFASDGFGMLQSKTYSNGEVFYYDYATLHAHFHNIIEKLDLFSYDQGFVNEIGYVMDWDYTGLDGIFYENLEIHHDAFKGYRGTDSYAFDCLYVLKQLLIRFNCRIIQQDGVFYIQQYGYLAGTGNKNVSYYYQTGAFNETISASFNVAAYQQLAGGVNFFREPAKNAVVKYAFKNGISSNMFGGNIIPTGGDLFNCGFMPNADGERFGFAVDYLVHVTDANTSTNPIRIKYDYTILCGGYYYVNRAGTGEFDPYIDPVWQTDFAPYTVANTDQLDPNLTADYIQSVGVICSVCPVEGDLFFRWTPGYWGGGNTPPAIYTITPITNAASIVYGENDPTDGTQVTTARATNPSGEIIEPEVLIIGDRPYGGSIGRIKYYDGADWMDTNDAWGFNAAEALNIDELLAREIMAMQKNAVKMFSMIIYSDVNVSNKIDGRIIMVASYVANDNIWTLECFEPVIDRTGITITTYTETNGTSGLPIGSTAQSQPMNGNAIEQSGNILKSVEAGAVFDQVAALLITDVDLTLDETHYTVLCDTTTVQVDLILPDATGMTGRIYRIRRWTGMNAVTITPTGYNSIIGSVASYASVTLSNNGEWFEIMSNGTDWYVVQDNPII